MSNDKVYKSLHQVLSDTYALYTKTQNYHWNVTGPYFPQLHKLFEEQYNELFAALDEIAERIRAVGFKVPAGLAVFSKNSAIKDGNEEADYKKMLKDLIDANSIVVAECKKAIEVAQKAGDEVSADLAIGRAQAHEKAIWMLESTLK